MKNLLVFLVLNSFTLLCFSQKKINFCGTDDAEHFNQYKKNIEAIRSGIIQERATTTYIPVKYILGAQTNGSGRASEYDVLDMHCHLNENYADQNIHFYIKDGTFDYINNDGFYDDHSIAKTIMTFKKDSNAVNVFIPKSAQPSTIGTEAVLGYYDRSRDWLVLAKNQVNNTSDILAHEMGHFFSLLHPHFGSNFYENHPNWPVAPDSTYEKMDGSNCRIAADMLCDTPPDYGFGTLSGCEYIGGAQDPCGVPIDPDETLIMAYYSDECAYRFTAEQKKIIIADLATPNRQYLKDSSFLPVTGNITNNIQIITPNTPVPLSQNSPVLIDWADMPAAAHFIFEYSSNRFFLNAKLFVLDISAIELTDIEPNKKYYYRIRPFNPTEVCTSNSKVFSFETTDSMVSSLDEISTVKNFKVFPNPAHLGESIYLSFFSKKILDGTLEIFDLTHKEIFSKKMKFKKGQNEIQISPNLKLNGIYILRIKTNIGILEKKFVVAE